MIISVEVDVPTRAQYRVSRIVGGAVAALLTALVIGMLASQGNNSTPPPPAPQLSAPLTAEQQTFLVYENWLSSAAFSDCMKSRGFAREAVAGSEHGRVAVVAQYLGIVPIKPDDWLAPAEARNGYPASAHSQGDDLDRALRGTAEGGCQGGSADVNLSDAAAVTAAVESARGDTAFYRYVAETEWLASNPADAVLFATHPLIAAVDPGAPRTSPNWGSRLDAVMAIVAATPGWTDGPREGYADFAQAVAVANDGSMIVVRVGEASGIDTGFVSAMDTPKIGCGYWGVILGATANEAPNADVGALYEALAQGACDAPA